MWEQQYSQVEGILSEWLGTSQARVDEGTNQVEVLNTDEIEMEYGRMITCTDCVNHGEAFLVVYNNTDRAKLKLSVSPVINLPICSTASSEFQQMKAKHSAEHKVTDDLPGPRTFVTWSCDDLSERITNGDLIVFIRRLKSICRMLLQYSKSSGLLIPTTTLEYYRDRQTKQILNYCQLHWLSITEST